jgi:hypothetical protein
MSFLLTVVLMQAGVAGRDLKTATAALDRTSVLATDVINGRNPWRR